MQTSETVKIQLKPSKLALIVADAEVKEISEFLNGFAAMARTKHGNADRYREFSSLVRIGLKLQTVDFLADLMGIEISKSEEIETAEQEGFEHG